MTAKSAGRMGANPLDIVLGRIDEAAAEETEAGKEVPKRSSGKAEGKRAKPRKTEDTKRRAASRAKEEESQEGGRAETRPPDEAGAHEAGDRLDQRAREPENGEAREPEGQGASEPESQIAFRGETYPPDSGAVPRTAADTPATAEWEQLEGTPPGHPRRLPGTQGVRPGGKKVTVVLPQHWHNLLKLVAVEKSMREPGQEWNISRVVEHALSLYDPRFK